ncbi:MAG: hypothetical protein NW206_16600 [Hyphomonadaceae bacterium]|nr:hypothetical protein [Hyphomonadaceae bacterium]
MSSLIHWIEAAVAPVMALLFLLSAMIMFKPEHVEHHPTRVYIGATLQGFILGLLIGFVILPLRLTFFVPDADLIPATPPQRGLASLSFLPALLLLIVIRRGLLARAPLIGPYLRAYRRAALKHQIDGARRALTRLEALDTRKAET